jgi:hypothetical protein
MTDPCEQCDRPPEDPDDRVLHHATLDLWLCGGCYNAIITRRVRPRRSPRAVDPSLSTAVDVENSPQDARRQTPDSENCPSGGKGNASSTGTSRKQIADGTAADRRDEPGYRERLEDLEAVGQLEPWDVGLDVGQLPRQAKSLRAGVARLESWFGLRLAYGDFRPVPLSRGFVAALMGWRDRSGELDRPRAREFLRAVERHGVIEAVDQLAGRGGWEGARLYLPPEPLRSELGYEPLGVAAGDGAVEREPGVIERAVAEPDAELADQAGVDRAEPAAGKDDWMVAVGFETAGLDALGRHGADDRPGPGVPAYVGGDDDIEF